MCLNFTKTDKNPFDALLGATLMKPYSFFFFNDQCVFQAFLRLQASVLPCLIKIKPN